MKNKFLFFCVCPFFGFCVDVPESFEKKESEAIQEVQDPFTMMYNLGVMQENAKAPLDSVLEIYLKAYEYSPTRAEPLHRIAILYRNAGKPLLGYMVAKFALTLPFSASDYFVLCEYANCALLSGQYEEGLQACYQLLAIQTLPANIKNMVISNVSFARRALQELK